ncbi:hypothetical protein DP107_14170 [Haloglomus irregulare]|uniref:Uncharacterized protein n=1 Tax=Haloglomus irregulare TaxID=2234134 RepID=A0A554MXD9_9EURY|nr:hypothetical protein [Haloglomus irregulare]TSD09796.1 hypothetical protein DP107_14170 [Haloglomus irregulare]
MPTGAPGPSRTTSDPMAASGSVAVTSWAVASGPVVRTTPVITSRTVGPTTYPSGRPPLAPGARGGGSAPTGHERPGG